MRWLALLSNAYGRAHLWGKRWTTVCTRRSQPWSRRPPDLRPLTNQLIKNLFWIGVWVRAWQSNKNTKAWGAGGPQGQGLWTPSIQYTLHFTQNTLCIVLYNSECVWIHVRCRWNAHSLSHSLPSCNSCYTSIVSHSMSSVSGSECMWTHTHTMRIAGLTISVGQLC